MAVSVAPYLSAHDLSVLIDFLLFAITLACVAIFHRHTLAAALIGLGVITLKKLLGTGFNEGPGLAGLLAHYEHEWVLIVNLFLLLVGFALLARHFEASRVPDWMPAALPDNWTGGLMLLVLVFVISSFLDNIAAALIGATVARHVFKGRVRIGYLAAIVAASNAGGSGSVIGDTTTTMMWIAGANPLQVLHAYVAAACALLVTGIPAALAQQKYAPMVKDPPSGLHISFRHVAVVVMVLASAIAANVGAHLLDAHVLDEIPLIGLAVAAALLLTAPMARPDWSIVPYAARGALFLIALVSAASMMPVKSLPAPSWETALGLGFVSAVFDNIPLTALALKQGNYDWGFLAYAVGFGGSMIWFGSSAGVAVAGLMPEARSAARWLKEGWPVALAYVAGFFLMLALLDWNPEPLARTG
ncbi:citrate transporter [Methyloceanibacter sp.]|uniref:citrate transporter n=1 Tax=Methyloceanibacter sp. TaxID=1965321 RepID=UPI003D6C9A0B